MSLTTIACASSVASLVIYAKTRNGNAKMGLPSFIKKLVPEQGSSNTSDETELVSKEKVENNNSINMGQESPITVNTSSEECSDNGSSYSGQAVDTQDLADRLSILELSETTFPKYTPIDKNSKPFIIGIAGGSASGKSSVSYRIINSLGTPSVVHLSMDSFYRPLTPEQTKLAYENNYNFDHPDAFDYDALYHVICELKKGHSVDVPIYDFNTHSRRPETTKIHSANVVIFEGIFALWDKNVRDLMDMKMFVDTDSDIRLARRLKRDIAERGRSMESVLEQYSRFVKPAFDEHIYPTMRYADVIIPRGLDNVAAIDVVTKHLTRQLTCRGVDINSCKKAPKP